MASFYVTTPIYYVNDLPHIGHIYTTLVADTVARYRRLCRDDVYFLTGTDEHGQNIQRAAAEKGLKPIELADRVVSRYHDLWRELGISHDDFVRTTEPRHRAAVEELIRRIDRAGDFYLDRHEGWYCSSCESFYTEKELLDDKSCPVHERPAEWQSEENVFFRLSKYQDALLSWYDNHPDFVRPQSRMNEVRAFVESGLRDLSVSRTNLDWGIPFPGYPGHVVYVWLDAVTNYASALGFGGDDAPLYERYWAGDDRRVVHLVGKDILRFHAVWWPAFLLSAGVPLPTTVWAHGWWLRDQKKMSKSTGNIVRPDDLVRDFGADSLRYFLLRDMVFGQDASFSDEAFIDRFNGDLANDLGNTVSRVAKLVAKHFDGRVPAASGDGPLAAEAGKAAASYREAMDELAFDRALKGLWRLLSEANQYLVAQEPWKLIKEPGNEARVGGILRDALEAVRVVSVGLTPILPLVAPRLLAATGAPNAVASLEEMAWGRLETGAETVPVGSLFPRIDKAEYLASATTIEGEQSATDDADSPSESRENEGGMITIDKFFETELCVGTVKAAEAIPNSSKLLKVVVDLGEEERTVVAGIAKRYRPEELVGGQVVIVANLAPAKLMGVESQGMVLAATVEGEPVLVRPEVEVPAGSQVR